MIQRIKTGLFTYDAGTALVCALLLTLAFVALILLSLGD